MSGGLQILIGISPLLLVALIFILRGKIRILSSIVAGVSLLAVVGGFVLLRPSGDVDKTEAVKQEASEDYYVYLADMYLTEGDIAAAEEVLKEMYLTFGDTPRATLLSARRAAVEGDLRGAKLLYDKLGLSGSDALMAEEEKTLLEKITSGSIMSASEAGLILGRVQMYLNAGYAAEDSGFSGEQIDIAKAVTEGKSDPSATVLEVISNEAEELEKKDSSLDDLMDMLALAGKGDALYRAYIAGEEYSSEDANDIYKELAKYYKKAGGAFAMAALDHAYVNMMAMNRKFADMATYADETDSAMALLALAQVGAAGKLSEKALPEGFLTLGSEEYQKLMRQCESAYKELEKKDNLSEAEMASTTERLKAMQAMEKHVALAEIAERVDPENADYRYSSALSLGLSAMYYGIGNETLGDEAFADSIATAPYAADDAYVKAYEGISSVIYDTADIDEVKNIADYIEEAYITGVPQIIWDEDSEDKSGKSGSYGGETEDYDDLGFTDAKEDDSPKKEDDEEEKESLLDKLTAQGTTYVSKQKAVLNIGKIDTSEFPVISFNLQTSDPLDLKNPGLILSDCGYNISEYTIEKAVFDTAKIYAVCDKSGSMEGSTDSLQAAVYSLASSISKKEMLGVIGFSSDVEFASPLTSNVSELTSYIEMLEANGGTNIASGAFYALNALSGSDDSLNLVIVMTDGEDSSFGSSELASLAAICDDGHTFVYTVGMGSSVNASYLSDIASYGNGRFVYSFSANELAALYEFIHAQMENNYIITFTAKDMSSSYRTLTVTNTADGGSVSKDYYVELEALEAEEEELIINGFKNKNIYVKDADVPATISGEKFESEMNCVVELTGESYKCALTGKYVSESEFTVVIPRIAPPGVYKAKISVGNKSMEETVEIMDGEPKSITYGAYTFTAARIVREAILEDGKETGREKVTLNGDIVMNKYLHFNGTLVLEGNFKESSIVMHDTGGSYVVFDKPQTALFGYITSTSQEIKPLGNYNLYKDDAHMADLDNYKTEEVQIEGFKIPAITTVGSQLTLYPHMIKVRYAELNFNLPFQDKIIGLKALSFLPKTEGFYECVVDHTGSYSVGKAYMAIEDGWPRLGTPGIKTFAWAPTEFNLEFDTFKKNYTFLLKGKISWQIDNYVPSISDYVREEKSRGDGLSFSIVGGYLDDIKVYFDHELSIPTEVGPITFDNFFVGASNLADAYKSANKKQDWTMLLKAQVQGGCNISLEKVSAFFGGKDAGPVGRFINRVFGDLALITFEDTTIKASLDCLIDPGFSGSTTFSSTVKLLSVVEYGNVDLRLGEYTVEDFMLGVNKRDVFGIYFEGNRGPKIDINDFKIINQGGVIFNINNVFSSYRFSGTTEYHICLIEKWLEYSGKSSAMLEFGFRCPKGKPTFYVAVWGESNDDNKGLRIKLSGWSWDKEYF